MSEQKEPTTLDTVNIVTIHRKRQLENQTISKGIFGTTSIKHWSPEKSPECYVTNLSHSEFSKQLKTQPFVSLYDPIREEHIAINTTEIADVRFKKCKQESEKKSC